MNYWLIFLTGLTTGGLSCLAVQGGLLTGVIANQKDRELEELDKIKRSNQKKKKKNEYLLKLKSKLALDSFDELDWMPVTMFLVAKLVSHTILGFFLGYLGESLTLSLSMRLLFQVLTAIFMFATAMNLLNVHPIFRYVVIQPPKFLQKFIRNSAKSRAFFTPLLLGFFTIFIPCGVTQAMEVLAINSANPISGALIMFFFVLGTSPLFALIGVATAKLSEGWHEKFLRLASYLLIGMAIYSFNGVLTVLDSPITLQKITRPVTYFFSDERFDSLSGANSAIVKNGVQQVTILAQNEGYSPNYVVVKKGVPVDLTLVSNELYTCAAAFVFREFGISTFLDATDEQTFRFTPTETGRFTFACSMGMYTGVMEVVE